MSYIAAFFTWLFGLFAKDVAVPVIETEGEKVLQGKLTIQAPPSTITDAPAEPTINNELQNDLSSQIANSTGKPPAGV